MHAVFSKANLIVGNKDREREMDTTTHQNQKKVHGLMFRLCATRPEFVHSNFIVSNSALERRNIS